MLHAAGRHPLAHGTYHALGALLPVGIVAAGALLVTVAMFRVDKKAIPEKIVLRDSSQALAGIQNVLDLMGMILRDC